MNSPKVVTVGEHTVTVRPADGIAGMRRHRIRYEQSQIKDDDPDSRLLRLTTYPDMVACADQVMPFALFAALPDAFLPIDCQKILPYRFCFWRLAPKTRASG